MLMIGVIPLPTLTNRSFSGSLRGNTKAPSTPPRRTIDPDRAVRTRCDETLPASTSLGVMLIHPSARSGSDVSEYARQWWIPSTTIPIRRYCPASCPGHSQPGRINTVAASGVSRVMRSIRPRSSCVDHNGLINSR